MKKQQLLALLFLVPFFSFAQFTYIDQSELYVSIGISCVLQKSDETNSYSAERLWSIDSFGRVTSMEILSSNENTDFTGDKFTYQNDLLKKKLEIYDFDPSTEKNDTIFIDYYYDTENNLTKEVSTYSTDCDTSIRYYSYKDGQVICSTRLEITSKYLQDSVYYDYDTNKILKTKTIKHFDENFIWLLVKMNYSQNRLKSQVEYYYGMDYPSSIKVFYYNKKLIEIQTLNIELYLGQQNITYKEEIEYNDFGLVSKITSYRNDELEKIETYIYK